MIEYFGGTSTKAQFEYGYQAEKNDHIPRGVIIQHPGCKRIFVQEED